MDNSQFESLADATLARLQAAVEAAPGGNLDAELVGGILTIEIESGGQFLQHGVADHGPAVVVGQLPFGRKEDAVQIGHALRADVELWMSSGRNEGGGSVLEAIRQMTVGLPNFKLVETGWQTWPEFRQTVRNMHLLLQR